MLDVGEEMIYDSSEKKVNREMRTGICGDSGAARTPTYTPPHSSRVVFSVYLSINFHSSSLSKYWPLRPEDIIGIFNAVDKKNLKDLHQDLGVCAEES